MGERKILIEIKGIDGASEAIESLTEWIRLRDRLRQVIATAFGVPESVLRGQHSLDERPCVGLIGSEDEQDEHEPLWGRKDEQDGKE